MRSMMKWEKFRILKQNKQIARLLPETKWMTEKNVWDLLNKYHTVILKPYNGFGGYGVIKVTQKQDNNYEVHYEQAKQILNGENLLPFLKEKIKSHTYIVQQWIPLSEVNGRPYDLRVMVQKRIHGSWVVTGKLAKVAGKGYIVTNIKRSKGFVLSLETAIRKSSLNSPIHSLQKKIDSISLMTAKCLQPYYPHIHMMGLDLGIDRNGKLWIIEVNFGPAISLFLHLKDKSMYKRILKYKNITIKSS